MTFHIFWTIVLMVVFVGIYLWAWSSDRKAAFSEASLLPLEDDKLPKNTINNRE